MKAYVQTLSVFPLAALIPFFLLIGRPTNGEETASHSGHTETNPPPKVWQAKGVAVSSLEAFDDTVRNFMKLREIERASLAVSKESRLVFARAYSWAPAGEHATYPTNLFRIASISKPITAVAIMQLVEAGKLKFDQPIGTILDLHDAVDPRMATVTIRQLLQHRGGWDPNVSFDPMFHDFAISKTLARPLPTTPRMVIDFMKTRSLDFEPGARYAYSNFGYCLLGRIIETVTGVGYETYIQQHVLEPVGIFDMRIGQSLLSEKAPAEVDYEDALRRVVRSVIGSDPAKVPLPYGGWNISTMDSHGGWLASASDLVRFACAFDVRTNSPLLSTASIEKMWSKPPGTKTNASSWYGAGWRVSLGKIPGSMNTWHNGSLDGTTTLLVRRWDGLNWAILFNKRPETSGIPDYLSEIDPALHAAANSVANWPTHDLFDTRRFYKVQTSTNTSARSESARAFKPSRWFRDVP